MNAGVPRTSRVALAAAAVAAGWIGLNAAKPFNVDDVFNLYLARTIAPGPGERPVDPVNWQRFEEPMKFQTRHHPTGWPLVLATVRRVTGDSERALHWLQWPGAAAYLAGAGLLARAFGAPVWPVFWLCAAGPLFLLPAASVMRDLPAAGPGLLGLALWLAPSSPWVAAVAGLLLVVAGQMKQVVLPLFPLLIFDAALRPRRDWRRWAGAAVIFALAGTYPAVAPGTEEGRTLLDHLAGLFGRAGGGGLIEGKVAYGLAVLGGLAVFPAGYVAALFARRRTGGWGAVVRPALAGAAAIPVLAVFGCWKPDPVAGGVMPGIPAGPNVLWFYAAIAAFTGWALAARDLLGSPRARWLAAAVGLVFGGYVVLAPFPAARHLIPLVPPLAVLLVLDLQRHLTARGFRVAVAATVAGSALLGGSLAYNDFRFARCLADAAAAGAARARAARLPLVTTGSWGLRWYVERHGGRVLGRAADPLPEGAVVLAPAQADHRVLPARLRRRVAVRETSVCVPDDLFLRLAVARTTPPAVTSASFHGGYVWFPYALSHGPLERIETLVIRPPARGGRAAP